MKTNTKEFKSKNLNLTYPDKEKYVGIYVHIPFCKARCTYCVFNTYVIDKEVENDVHEQYIQAVIKELKTYSEKVKGRLVNTIFFGGGTPSMLKQNGIPRILDAIREFYTLETGCEITMELNPFSYAKVLAHDWKKAGVNRISVGLQTANNDVLKTVNRTHTVEMFIETIKGLQSAGIENINADIILGLPKQTMDHVKYSIKLINKLGLKHVSAYGLIIEDEAPLKRQLDNGEITLPSEEETVKMYNTVNKMLKRRGFSRYEVSNFAKTNLHSRHNLNCWEMYEYIGIGAGAHGYFNGERYSNYKPIHKYIEEVNTKTVSKEFSEFPDKDQLLEDTVMLGMRTKWGINLNEIKEKFGVDLKQDKFDVVKKFKKIGLIGEKNGNLFVKSKGFYVLNKIIVELLYKE